jgi:hypothetical protein
MRQQLSHLLVLSFGSGLVVLASVATAGTQTLVGTGDPDIDVPAVQAAVDQGGEVILRGHFSFDRDPTIPLAPVFQESGYPQAMVLVSRAVAISGARDEHDDDEMTSIEAGTIPFYVEAPGAALTIRGLRFVRPAQDAILVYAVSGLVIASCKIEGARTVGSGNAQGIEIDTSAAVIPQPPGHPENISGTLLIVNNDIDMSIVTASSVTLPRSNGIVIFYVGVPGAEVAAYVSGNAIRNFHNRAMSIRGVGGRTYVEGNVIATGTVSGGPGTNQSIFVGDLAGSNSYLIAHNSVDVQWATGSAAGIAVRQAIAHAIVVDNDVNMGAPEGTLFDDESAGIEINGNSHDNVVQGNRITGHARAALSVGPPTIGDPANNAFILNRLDGFEPTLADIFVGDGVMNTLIVGSGTIEDHGVGTVIVPVGSQN